MASELCDAQEVIHELLGTGASHNETEYNYTVSKVDVNRERVLEYLLAQGMVICTEQLRKSGCLQTRNQM